MIKNKTQIPDGWELVRLGDLCAPPQYGASAAARPFEANLPRYVRITDIADDGRLRVDDPRSAEPAKVEGYELESGDLLFARSGSVGRTYLYRLEDGPCVYAGYLIRFRPNPMIVLPRFIELYTHSPLYHQWIASVLRVGAQPNINANEYSSLPLLLPPLPEQRAIAAVLDSIDEAIKRTEAVIAATERLRDALLHELLTRGVPGWHSKWKEAPGIGTIPACWEVVRLGDCLADGPTNGIYKPESEYGEGEWLIRIDDFTPGALTRLSGFKRIRVTEVESQRYAVCKGDILINRVNSLSHLGKSVLIPQLGEPALFESNMMRLRMCPDVDPEFIMTVLLSRPSKRYFTSTAKKAVQQASINQQDVRLLPLPLPDRREQALIAEASTTLKKRIRFDSRALMNLKTLKALTADALLTGRIRMPTDMVWQDG